MEGEEVDDDPGGERLPLAEEVEGGARELQRLRGGPARMHLFVSQPELRASAETLRVLNRVPEECRSPVTFLLFRHGERKRLFEILAT